MSRVSEVFWSEVQTVQIFLEVFHIRATLGRQACGLLSLMLLSCISFTFQPFQNPTLAQSLPEPHVMYCRYTQRFALASQTRRSKEGAERRGRRERAEGEGAQGEGVDRRNSRKRKGVGAKGEERGAARRGRPNKPCLQSFARSSVNKCNKA